MLKRTEKLSARRDGSLKLAVVADTHSSPHPMLARRLGDLRPDAILHAGDIGDAEVIQKLSAIAPTLAVRGNIDAKDLGIPDVLIIDVDATEPMRLRILLLHIGVAGPKLRADVARLARAEAASMVVCGHSHVPFIGQEPGVTVFNPGSCGPRRFHLPIVFGTVEVTGGRVRLGHVDCETGKTWLPP